MPNNILTIFSEEEQYNSNLRYYKFMIDKLDINYDDFPLTYENVNTINEYLRKDKKTRIATSMNSPIHMFFKFGYIHSINEGFSSYEILDDKCYIITDEFKKEISIDLIKIFDFGLYNFWCKQLI